MKIFNKYTITFLIFAVVMCLVGEQSLRVRIHKARKIHDLKEQRDAYDQGISESKRMIQSLQSTDSLERYAREHYLMHTDMEDVFLVEEDD